MIAPWLQNTAREGLQEKLQGLQETERHRQHYITLLKVSVMQSKLMEWMHQLGEGEPQGNKR